MKKYVTILIIFLFTFFASGLVKISAVETAGACNEIFPDLTVDHSLCPYVEYMYHQGIISGYSNGNFGPDDFVTRGQIAKILKNAFNIPTDTSGERFPDVPEDYPFFEAIQSIKNAGLASGYTTGEYKPKENVSRGALMKLAVIGVDVNRTDSFFNEMTGAITDYFPDVSEDYTFVEYILTGVENEIISGYQDGTFRPDQNMTRAQIAKVVTNLMKLAGYEDVECAEYFCQDKYIPPFDENWNQYTGNFFEIKYPDNWAFESGLEDLGGGTDPEEIYNYIDMVYLYKDGTTENDSEAMMMVIAIPLEFYSEYSLTMEGEGGFQNMAELEAYWESILSDPAQFEEIFWDTNVLSHGMVENNIYRIEMEPSDPTGEDYIYGYFDQTIHEEYYYTLLTVTTNPNDMTEIDNVLSTFTPDIKIDVDLTELENLIGQSQRDSARRMNLLDISFDMTDFYSYNMYYPDTFWVDGTTIHMSYGEMESTYEVTDFSTVEVDASSGACDLFDNPGENTIETNQDRLSLCIDTDTYEIGTKLESDNAGYMF
ncbi:hypothetical protein GF362_07375 [Candidatus Dojkabacteria bacterium]|nr:hypothetical protein [Candidatus Dojkabacteria bacterium]